MSTKSTIKLNSLLRRTARLVVRTETLTAIASLLVVLLGAVLLAVALDTALALANWALVFVDGILVAMLLSGGAYLAWVRHCNKYDPRRTARLIETRLGIADNRLINAVELAAQQCADVSLSLLEASVAEGEKLAEGISPKHVPDSTRLRKRAIAAGLMILITLVSVLTLPGVFSAVAARYLQPSAGHPPFTLVTFEISVQPERIYAGQAATITAKLSSGVKLEEQANVVFVDDQEGPSAPAPMLYSGQGSFVLNIERAEQSRRFYIETPAGRSEIREMIVLPAPSFKRIRVTYDYPVYTNWPPSVQTLGPNYDIRALAGTRVTVTVTSNQPLASGRMTIIDPENADNRQNLSLAVTDNPMVVRTQFMLGVSGRYELGLVNPDGIQADQNVRGSIVSAEDQLPEVSIVSPPVMVVAPENWKIPIAIIARDDVGVRRIVLYRGVNAWPPAAIELPLTKDGSPPLENLTYATGRYEFDLGELGAAPGDVITYYASAWDVHPRVDHFADTPAHVIRVVGKEEYLQHARMTYQLKEMQREIDEYLDALDEIEQLRRDLLAELEAIKKRAADNNGKLSPTDRKKLDHLVEKQDEYAERMRELDKDLKRRIEQMKIYDFEQAYLDSLSDLAIGLTRRADKNHGLTTVYRDKASDGLSDAEAKGHIEKTIDQLRRAAPQAKKAEERAKLTREQLALLKQADELVALVEQIVAIADQQTELAGRLGQFSNTERLTPTEQIRARRMAGEQTKLRGELEKTLKGIETKAKAAREKLPKMSKSAEDLVRGIRDLGVIRDQDDAARLAQAGQGRYASRAANDAATKLNSLIEESGGGQGMMQQAGADIDRKLSLTRQQIASGLAQLSQGRGIPGQGGSKGKGQGGQYGSRAKLTLVGPHGGGGGDDAKPTSALQGSGRKNQPNRKTLTAKASESLSPNNAPERMKNRGIGAMPGVPVRYRGLVELYFRRLADESK